MVRHVSHQNVSDPIVFSLPWLTDRDGDVWKPFTSSTTADGWMIRTEWRILHGRPEPVSIRVHRADDDIPVTADLIRRLPLGAALAIGRRQTAEYAVLTIAQARRGDLDVPEGNLPQFTQPVASQRGRRLTDDDLAAVASVYRAAWTGGLPVTDAVQRAFTLSRDGASKRIMAARKAGLLDGIGPKR